MRQEQMSTKINKTYITGKVSQRTSTISHQLSLIPPKSKVSKENIIMHKTSNSHNSLISQPNPMVQSAELPPKRDLQEACIDFMNYQS
jgi:hypothetical protein